MTRNRTRMDEEATAEPEEGNSQSDHGKHRGKAEPPIGGHRPVIPQSTRAASIKRALGGAPTRVCGEHQDETIAVFDDELTLLVNPILGTIENLCSAASQLLCQRVHRGHLDVGIAYTHGATGATSHAT